MSVIGEYISCPAVQMSLLEAFGYDNHRLENVNITRFLLSGVNTDGVKIQSAASPGNGKLRQVELIYDQRLLIDTVSDVGNISCEGGDELGDLSTTYEIDPTIGASASWTVTPAEMTYRCNTGDRDWIAHQLKKRMDVIIRKMERDGAIYIAANTGNFASRVDEGNAPSNTPETINTLTTTGANNPIAAGEIAFNNEANGFITRPMIFGGRVWDMYARAMNAACCGVDGIDGGLYLSQNSFMSAYSPDIMQVSGANDVFAVQPKMVQILHYGAFQGGFDNTLVINDNALVQGSLLYTDSTLPVMFDYRAELVCINNVFVWRFNIATAYQHVGVPDDMYAVGDRLEGVNGITEYVISNP